MKHTVWRGLEHTAIAKDFNKVQHHITQVAVKL